MGKITEIVLIIVTVVSFGLTLLANYLFGLGEEVFGLNFTSVGDVSDIYDTNITPSGWTFSIWGVIYVWQGVWMVYFITLLFRKSDDGNPLHPVVCNVPLFYFFYLANLYFNISWIMLWCLEYVEYAMMFIALIGISLWCALGTSVYGVTHQAQDLSDRGNKKDIWMNIIFLQNGICIYGTWVTIATMINLNIVLVYYGGLSMVDGSTIALFCLATVLVTWFILEMFVFEKACRYCFLPYMVVAYAVGGSVDKNWTEGSANSIISVTIIAVALALLVVKVLMAVYNEKKNPLYTVGGYKSNQVDANADYNISITEKL